MSDLSPALKQQLDALVAADTVVLFMKGTRDQPRCGFSAAVVEMLDGLLPAYRTVDVLADPAIREGIKAYSDWPTIPQLYIKGEFVGGADIAREMFQNGELHKKLGVTEAGGGHVALQITEPARAALAAAHAEELKSNPGHTFLRVSVSKQFQHGLSFGPELPGDAAADTAGLAVRVDAGSARRAAGLRIDAVNTPQGLAFRLENPNEPPRVKAMTVTELRDRIASKAPLTLFDVRTDGERAQASIAGAVPFDAAGQARLAAAPKDAPVAFICHHGGRSQAAASQAVAAGFTHVWNVHGGIDAWSLEVDPTVPRYT